MHTRATPKGLKSHDHRLMSVLSDAATCGNRFDIGLLLAERVLFPIVPASNAAQPKRAARQPHSCANKARPMAKAKNRARYLIAVTLTDVVLPHLVLALIRTQRRLGCALTPTLLTGLA